MFGLFRMFGGFNRSSGAEDLLSNPDVKLDQILELNDIDTDFKSSNAKVLE